MYMRKASLLYMVSSLTCAGVHCTAENYITKAIQPALLPTLASVHDLLCARLYPLVISTIFLWTSNDLNWFFLCACINALSEILASWESLLYSSSISSSFQHARHHQLIVPESRWPWNASFVKIVANVEADSISVFLLYVFVSYSSTLLLSLFLSLFVCLSVLTFLSISVSLYFKSSIYCIS